MPDERWKSPVQARSEARREVRLEPRWPAILGVIAVGGLHWAIPEPLTVGPSWLLLVVVLLLLIPTMLARHTGRVLMNEIFGYAISAVVTLAMTASLVLLVHGLPAHKQSPQDLLQSAAALWLTNILVFASWYWRLDAGGPNERERRAQHRSGAFLFPQMTMAGPAKSSSPDFPSTPERSSTGGFDQPGPLEELDEDDDEYAEWRPGFVDYLFLAFNTSTAFSPTDVPVLSRWAKLLMMVQATISFTTVALLAARAVNIL